MAILKRHPPSSHRSFTHRITKKVHILDPSESINWRRLSDRITLSGQPTEDQLAQIANLGVAHVINLGPHHNKGALPDEAGTVQRLGMNYIYIPVEFDAPSDKDFASFCAALDRTADDKIHVHCIYNARVTAFFFRLAREGRFGTVDQAFDMMDGIWRPGHDWAGFIGDPNAKDRPNQYAGYDY